MTKFEQYLEAIRKQKAVKEKAEVVEEKEVKETKSEIINNKRNK